MIEDVQRQVAGLSLQDNRNNYSSFGNQTQRSMPQQIDPRPQTPYYQPPPEQPPMAGYSHTPTPYGSSHQPPPPYHIPPPSAAPYQPSQAHQQPPVSHEYGQPAYPGWRGPYYNAQVQQPASVPRPPYTIPSPYPPHQGGYYKQQ